MLVFLRLQFWVLEDGHIPSFYIPVWKSGSEAMYMSGAWNPVLAILEAPTVEYLCTVRAQKQHFAYWHSNWTRCNSGNGGLPEFGLAQRVPSTRNVEVLGPTYYMLY